jgi:hypothetical protein
LQRAKSIIRNLIAIFDSAAMKQTYSVASVHGFSCDEETSIRHGRYIAEAREFLV